MKNTLPFLLIIFLFSCNPKDPNKIYVDANFKNYESWMAADIKFYPVGSLNPAPDTSLTLYNNGELRDTLQFKKSGYYIITLGVSVFQAFLEKGKEFKFSSDYVHFADNLKFEGDNADINTFLFRYQQKMNETPLIFNQIDGETENDFFATLKNQENKINKFIDSVAKNVPDSVINQTKIDAKYSLSMLYFRYNERHTTSSTFFNFQERYDFNNPQYLAISTNYGAALFSHCLYQFKNETGNTVVSAEQLDTFLQSKKMKDKIREFVLTKYAIDVLFEKGDAEKENAYNYLSKTISERAYVMALYKSFIRHRKF